MLFDEKNDYEFISESIYNKQTKDIENGDATIEKSICIFYREEDNIVKKEIFNKEDIINDKNILVKYYIERIKLKDQFIFNTPDVGDAYHIYNLGYFFISDFAELMSKESKEEYRKLFLEYDKSYQNMKFPFNDYDFLTKTI